VTAKQIDSISTLPADHPFQHCWSMEIKGNLDLHTGTDIRLFELLLPPPVSGTVSGVKSRSLSPVFPLNEPNISGFYPQCS
jgi:hypothetical protein